MAKSRPTQHKRARERARQEKREQKANRRAELKSRAAAAGGTPVADGEDPDIAGIVPGPQASPWGEEEE